MFIAHFYLDLFVLLKQYHTLGNYKEFISHSEGGWEGQDQGPGI